MAKCVDFVAGYSPHLDCIRYTPDDGFRGVDQIPYTISDGRGGTASTTYWLAVDHPEMAIDSADPSSGPPAGGQSVIINGQNFMPTVGVQFVCGGVSYPAPITAVSVTQLTVTTPPMPAGTCDVHAQHLVLTGLASATLGAGYTVVSGDNHPPVAVDDSVTVRQTNSVDVAVLANDSDPDGDAIHVVSSTQPAHGHLDSFAVDTYNYTPNAGYLGPDSFTYTIEDSQGASVTATVNITVTAGLGSVRANVLYEDSGLALGEQACFELLDGVGARVGSVQCLNPAGQTAVFSNVPLGDYSVAVAYTSTIPSNPPSPRLQARYAVPAPIAVHVTRDGLAEIVTANVKLRKLIVGAVGPGGTGVGQMCYRLTPTDSASGASTLDACSAPIFGVPLAVFGGVWAGITYRLDITSHPAGVFPVAGESGKTVGPFGDSSEANSTTVRMIGDDTLVRVVGPDNAVVTGVCIGIYASANSSLINSACDVDDGASDGTTAFQNLPAGAYYARPTPFPAGNYAWPARGTTFTRVSGELTQVDYRLEAAQTASITLVDTAGRAAPNGCLRVTVLGAIVGEPNRCDGDDGTVDAVVHFQHLAAPFIFSQFVNAYGVAPPGTVPGDAVRLDYANGHADATYVWGINPRYVVLRLVDPAGALVPGQCWMIQYDPISHPFGFGFQVCDDADGASDGVTLADGNGTFDFYNYYARPYRPAGAWAWPDVGIPIYLDPHALQAPVFTYQLQPAGLAAITMVDSAGRSVPGACLGLFSYQPTDEGVRCDADDGVTDSIVHFEHVNGSAAVNAANPVPNGLTAGDNVTIGIDPATHHADATYVWGINPRYVVLRLVDPAGALVPGQCWMIQYDPISHPFGFGFQVCDDADGASDGVTLADGNGTFDFYNYYARPYRPAGAWAWPDVGIPIYLDPHALQAPVFTYQLQPAGLAAITMVDSAGRSVPGACLGLFSYQPTDEGVRCDADDGVTDSIVHFEHVNGSAAVNAANPVPNGLTAGDNVTIGIDPATHHADATYVWGINPRYVVLRLVDPAGALVPGQCWMIQYDPISHPFGFGFQVCDDADGASDGVTLADGNGTFDFYNYYARPYRPAGAWAWPDVGIPIYLDPHALQAPVFTYQLQPAGLAAITMVDSAGRSVPGACLGLFSYQPTDEGVRCDADDGVTDSIVHFEHVNGSAAVNAANPVPNGLTAGDNVTIGIDPATHHGDGDLRVGAGGRRLGPRQRVV